ncbi:MAG: hypothetical protein ACK44F_09670 [Roseococcus sp.]|jgi:hypothetical protein
MAIGEQELIDRLLQAARKALPAAEITRARLDPFEDSSGASRAGTGAAGAWRATRKADPADPQAGRVERTASPSA